MRLRPSVARHARLTRSNGVSLSLSRARALSLARSRARSLPLPPSLPSSLPLSIALALAFTLFSLPPSLPLSRAPSLPPSLPPSLSPSPSLWVCFRSGAQGNGGILRHERLRARVPGTPAGAGGFQVHVPAAKPGHGMVGAQLLLPLRQRGGHTPIRRNPPSQLPPLQRGPRVRAVYAAPHHRPLLFLGVWRFSLPTPAWHDKDLS